MCSLIPQVWGTPSTTPLTPVPGRTTFTIALRVSTAFAPPHRAGETRPSPTTLGSCLGARVDAERDWRPRVGKLSPAPALEREGGGGPQTSASRGAPWDPLAPPSLRPGSRPRGTGSGAGAKCASSRTWEVPPIPCPFSDQRPFPPLAPPDCGPQLRAEGCGYHRANGLSFPLCNLNSEKVFL